LIVNYILQLLGILLVGDPTDYRLPSIQTFVAPYEDTITPPEPQLINGTSLFMIGDTTECVLTKGDSPHQSGAEIRVRTKQSAKPLAKKDTFCKLSYKNLPNNLADPSATGGTRTPEQIARSVLHHDQTIKIKDCWMNENYTEATVTKIEAKIKAIETILDADSTKELDPLKWFVKPYGLPDEPAGTDPLAPDARPTTDPCSATPADCEEKKIKEDVKAAIAAVKAIYDAKPKPLSPADQKAKKDQLIKDTYLIKLRNCRSTAFLLNAQLEAIKTEIKAKWETPKASIDTAVKALDVAFKIFEPVKDDYDKNEDPTEADKKTYEAALKVYEEAEKLYLDAIQVSALELAEAQSMDSNLRRLAKRELKKSYEKLVSAYKIAKAGGNPNCTSFKAVASMTSATIVITKDSDKEVILLEEPKDSTQFNTVNDDQTCGELPKAKCNQTIKYTHELSIKLINTYSFLY
jgi:hypothetical protein